MADDFEERHLATGDEVVHRERTVMRGAFAILTALAGASAVGVAVGVAIAIGGDPQGLAAAGLFGAMAATLGLAGVTGTVVRTIVTRRDVILHTGVRKETYVPLASITRVCKVPLDPETRRRMRAEAARGGFAAVGAGPSVVRIEWEDAGVQHETHVGSDHPDVLVDAIERACLGAPGIARVRVNADARGEGAEAEASARAAGAEEREQFVPRVEVPTKESDRPLRP